MIRHIFKKDWRLLWQFFLVVAALQFIPGIIRVKRGLFGGNPALDFLSFPSSIIAVTGAIFLIVAIVHQDPIPGLRQDWLVRPVRRKDLLLAKILFVLVLVQSSIVAADVVQGLASGFPIGPSFSAALAHSVYWIFTFTLPALAFASITRSMTEAIVAAAVALCGGLVVDVLAVLADGGKEYLRQTSGADAAWVSRYCAFLLVLLAACAVLGIQYFRRKTIAARWIVATVLVLVVLVQFLPWKFVFALQQQLSPNPGAGRSVSLAFDPSLGKFQRPSGTTMSDEGMVNSNLGEAKSEVFLPLRLSGLPNNAVLNVDKSEVRFIDSNGQVVYKHNGNDWQILKEGPNNGQATIYQEVNIPDAWYRRLKNQPLQVKVDYSLTLFRLGASYGIPALGGDQRAPELGWCQTRINGSGTAVEIRCLHPGNGFHCATAFLENASTGLRNPTIKACEPDYSPSFERSNKSPMSLFGLNNLFFRDPAGLTHFPVEGLQLSKSRVVVRIYDPADHFTGQMVTRAVRLTDWESQ